MYHLYTLVTDVCDLEKGTIIRDWATVQLFWFKWIDTLCLWLMHHCITSLTLCIMWHVLWTILFKIYVAEPSSKNFCVYVYTLCATISKVRTCIVIILCVIIDKNLCNIQIHQCYWNQGKHEVSHLLPLSTSALFWFRVTKSTQVISASVIVGFKLDRPYNLVFFNHCLRRNWAMRYHPVTCCLITYQSSTLIT